MRGVIAVAAAIENCKLAAKAANLRRLAVLPYIPP
jgi:hypothetical protein